MIRVIGGTYWERCLEPEWDALVGSGYRAASVLASSGISTALTTRVGVPDENLLRTYCAGQGLTLDVVTSANSTLSFRYSCPLDEPLIRPTPDGIVRVPLRAESDVVVAFGMLDGDITFSASTAVWDPQSSFPIAPSRVGKAKRLAIVANASQVRVLSGKENPEDAIKSLATAENATVVISKNGLSGASIYAEGQIHRVPAYRSKGAFTIGSGDVFTAIFAREWGIENLPAHEAADLASRAVASYTETQSLEGLTREYLTAGSWEPLVVKPGRVYLAAPFFNLQQLMMLELAEHALSDAHLQVASPLREVGTGPSSDVAPADLALLRGCDRVFALLPDLDPGSIFELGYAHEEGIPVVAYAPHIAEHHRTMLEGTGVKLFENFARAVVEVAMLNGVVGKTRKNHGDPRSASENVESDALCQLAR
jgi:nucleoside 2-deoxyribosyltransferase